MTSHIFAKDLQYLRRQRELHRIELYRHQMNKCFEAIRQASTSGIGKEYTLFTIPYVIPGEPSYNFEECVKYIKRVLKQHGFKRNRVQPGNVIFISWESDSNDIFAETRESHDSTRGSDDSSGGVVIEYDPNDPQAEAKIRQEIARLRRLSAPS